MNWRCIFGHAWRPSISMPTLAVCSRGCGAVTSIRPQFRRVAL